MEAGQPDSKRPRLMSWSSSSGPQPPSLLQSHASKQLPPPQPHPSGPHGHPTPYPPPFPPRHSDLSSGPPTPAASHGLGLQHPDADRRRHEQDALAPMHEHYRQQPAQQQPPPHSPARPPFAGYPGRDVSIKRESLEDARRSNSISGHGPEVAHSQHHPLAPSHSHSQGPPPPPPHIAPSYSEGQRHMGYDNPSSVPPTPGGYRHYPPPPTPMNHTQPSYEPQTPYQSTPTAAAPPEPIYSVYSSSAANPMKKKNTRASQACDQCRQLKAKCDETKPCKTCRDKGTECRYRDPIPKATDKAHTDILDGISMMQNGMASLSEHFKRLEERMVSMQSFMTGHQVEKGKDFVVPRVATQKNGDESVLKLDLPPKADQTGSNSAGTAATEQGDGAAGETHPLRMMDEDEMEAEPGPPVAPGEPAIPMNHTTLAGLLLEWSSIRELTKHHLDRQGVRFISEYPISTEQRRGLLIPYGRGEDVHPSRQPREQLDHSSLDASEDSSDMASPSPAADWGHVGGMSPSEHIEYRGGALTPEGGPDFSEAKVWSYVESFKENILNMHPVIQPPILDDWIRHFLSSIPASNSRSTPKPQTVKSAFAVGGSTPPVGDSANLKRKRSPEPDSDEANAASSSTKFRPSRTIHTALILTILALGKVCLHKECVPDALQIAESLPRGSPMSRNGTLSSPSQGSPPNFLSRSQSTGLPSPRDNGEPAGFHSRRSSFHGATAVRSGYGLQKNYDVIPGLEYFAYATDILGNHLGSYNNMKNVYTNIFAGLYQGQLGRPLESFAFIHQASHKLQVIMRPSLDKLRKFRQTPNYLVAEPKYNQLALAFWTCLQLESDLIAELPLPPSGLLSYENDMPHPNMSLLRGFPQNVLDSYPGQLYLRTHLNSIHRMFYSPEDPNRGSRGEEKFQNVQLVVDSVSDMRWAAPSFAFKESDPPASDILAARLRAKYWGAQVITYRPFIRQLLQFSHNSKHPLSPNPPATSEFRSDIDVPRIAPQAKSSSEIHADIIAYAKKGIKALVESTRAFHGLGEDRPIITNVFGTAHAQWGNLLVLSAASRDPILKKFVDMQLLEHLFQKTIRFLRQSATSTSSLRIDMHILEGLSKDLFGASASSSSTHLQTPQLPMAAPNTVPPSTENGDDTQNGHCDDSATPN